MKKHILTFAFLSTSAVLFAAPYFVSHQGGLWSASTTWNGNAIPQPPIDLRMDAASGNLEIDKLASPANMSVWGKPQNIHILDGAIFELAHGGFNMQDVSMCISGSGFFKCKGNTLLGYGGNGGKLSFVSNVELSKITFDNHRKLIKDLTVSMNQPIDRIFKTPLKKDGKTYSNLSVSGVSGAKTRVDICGNTTVGDIDVLNSAHLVIDTPRLFLSGEFRKIEVTNATLELRRNGPQYLVYSKVRLNGNATLKLVGESPLLNRAINVLFLSGNQNTVKLYGHSEISGFTVYDNGKKNARTINIVIPKNSKGTVLSMNSFVVCPAAKVCLADNSLSQTGAGAKVSDVSINIKNFRNNAIKVAKGFKDPADYAKIKADGFKNFRLQNGFLVADPI